MKKLEIIIKPEKLEDLKAVLESSEVNGLNIVNSMGYGSSHREDPVFSLLHTQWKLSLPIIPLSCIFHCRSFSFPSGGL